jgi:heptosyltransferase-2
VKQFRQDSVAKVLIRSVNWIGDAVMTTPAIAMIREHFSNAEITVLANEMVSQLLLHHPGIDRIITFERGGKHRGVAGRLRLAAELRKHAFNLAIIFPNSFDAAVVPWLAGIPARIGKCSDGRTLLLNGRYRAEKKSPPRHEVEYYLNLMRHFGITGSQTPLQLFITSEEEKRATALLAEYGIQPEDFVLGINPGASYGSAKRWYPDRFAQVALRLTKQWQAKIVIFGGPGETAIAADIEKNLEGNAVNLAGKTSVRELMALIRRCNFFITNDSGPMHIAAAFDVPLVAVFGSTDHTGTSPYSSHSVVVRNTSVECTPCKLRECPTDHRCMTTVTVDAVAGAALELAERLQSRASS